MFLCHDVRSADATELLVLAVSGSDSPVTCSYHKWTREREVAGHQQLLRET